MDQKYWFTKKEVIEDLALVTGPNVSKIDDGFLLYGEAPPPPLEYIEDESQLQYYGVNKNKLLEDIPMEPDLKGIMQMIQMVNNYENNTEHKEKLNTRDNTITISKLNPEVVEFVPKAVHNNLNSSNNVVPNGVSESNNSDTKSYLTTNTSYMLPTKTEELINRNLIAKALKHKINEANKSDKLQRKKEKNLAIASLLKLYSSKSTPQINNDRAIKLVTPDYYENKISVEDHKEQINLRTSNPSTPRIDNNKVVDYNILSNGNQITDETLNNNDTPIAISDKELNNSIWKVNNWLDRPNNAKVPVYLGQVAFKRKEPISRQSPNETEKKVAKSTLHNCVMYKPSKYANELGKLYIERNKIKERLEQDLWTKVSNELKSRDVIIKKQLLEERAKTEAIEISEESTDPIQSAD